MPVWAAVSCKVPIQKASCLLCGQGESPSRKGLAIGMLPKGKQETVEGCTGNVELGYCPAVVFAVSVTRLLYMPRQPVGLIVVGTDDHSPLAVTGHEPAFRQVPAYEPPEGFGMPIVPYRGQHLPEHRVFPKLVGQCPGLGKHAPSPTPSLGISVPYPSLGSGEVGVLVRGQGRKDAHPCYEPGRLGISAHGGGDPLPPPKMGQDQVAYPYILDWDKPPICKD